MMIVMGLDQHRAQITTEWLDTATGEIGRARVSPAHREGVRRFLGRFAGRELEVALEATTGWRFVVEELRRVGAGVHLAEPAETSALRGNKKRPKSDRADAKHLRELLMIGRLPESWIPPDHLLDLRSKVRLRHTLVDQRGEWQQRIRAVLYHHGLPNRELHLLGREGRAWLDEVEIRDAAREQITVAVAMSETLDFQIAPLDKQLRAYARRQRGCHEPPNSHRQRLKRRETTHPRPPAATPSTRSRSALNPRHLPDSHRAMRQARAGPALTPRYRPESAVRMRRIRYTSRRRGRMNTRPHQCPVAQSTTTMAVIHTPSSSRITSAAFWCRRSHLIVSRLPRSGRLATRKVRSAAPRAPT